MSYRQTVNPNLDPVVYVDGKVLRQWREWCLACVRAAFGAPYSGGNAWQGWTQFTKFKHQDRNFPVGVYFPIWFSGYRGLGHVAFAYVNGNGSINIWTSPWEYNKPYFDTYESIDRLISSYKLDSFVGWSEDIAGMRVIEPVADPVPAPAPAPQPAAPNRYSRFPQPLNLVTNKQPTRVWNLSAITWTTFKESKESNQGTPFTAVGKYNHPLGGVYFMDEAAFGNADASGTPNANEGINTVDLSPAPTPPPAPAPEPQPTLTITDNTTVPPTVTTVPPPVDGDKVEVKVLPPNPDAWKTSFKVNTAGEYVALADTKIYDLSDPSATPMQLVRGQKVPVGGSFDKDGIEYYRTKKWVEENRWLGIPKASLGEDESEFDYSIVTEVEREVRNLRSDKRIKQLVGLEQKLEGWFKHKK